MPVPRVRVVTDSTADLPPDLARRLNISIIPANIQFGSESFLDGINLSRDEFYQRLSAGPDLPTTSAPAVGVFSAAYRRAADDAVAAGEPLEGIIAIHLASRLSALFNAAWLGAEAVTETRVRVLDSQQLSIGTGLLAVAAARAAHAGASLNEIAALVEERTPRVRLLAMLDTLDYVQRSGRLGRAQWLVGTLLSIKPIISVYLGEVGLAESVRTRSAAVDRLVEMAGEAAPFEELAVVHARAPELGLRLTDRLAELHPSHGVIFGEVGVTIGTYAGPGAVGFIGMGRE
jgi:DegV family protein with EDD domain